MHSFHDEMSSSVSQSNEKMNTGGQTLTPRGISVFQEKRPRIPPGENSNKYREECTNPAAVFAMNDFHY